MTRAEAFTLALPMAAIVVMCLIGWACERYIRRRPRNHYRRTPLLPPPSEQCRRTPDWRSQAPQTRF